MVGKKSCERRVRKKELRVRKKGCGVLHSDHGSKAQELSSSCGWGPQKARPTNSQLWLSILLCWSTGYWWILEEKLPSIFFLLKIDFLKDHQDSTFDMMYWKLSADIICIPEQHSKSQTIVTQSLCSEYLSIMDHLALWVYADITQLLRFSLLLCTDLDSLILKS